jgi:hypothetical protein
MAMKKFRVTLTADVEIEIDEAVIALALTEEWRKRSFRAWQKTFYHMADAIDVAAHIAYNMVVNNATLSSLDGFADRKVAEARIKSLEWESEAEEI